MISAFKQLVFKPVQTGCLPITDRGVSRALLYISGRQAPQTSNSRGFQLRRRENFNAQASLTKKMKRSFEYTWSSDEEDDDLLYRAMEEWERTVQIGGGARKPLFEFTLTSIGQRRRWKNVVERAQFRAELRQLREPVVGDDIGSELANALHTAIQTEVLREERSPQDFVNFSITAHGFTHAYQTINFQVGEFLARSVRLNELLENLAAKLNSNESFDHNQGFNVEVVFVKRPQPGSGKKKTEMWVRDALITIIKKKNALLASTIMINYAVRAA